MLWHFVGQEAPQCDYLVGVERGYLAVNATVRSTIGPGSTTAPPSSASGTVDPAPILWSTSS